MDQGFDVYCGLDVGKSEHHATALIVVDQPNTIGALPVAVARDCGCEVAYLPGLAMRKAADLYPGYSKTDARDAFIIAETARAMPHTLRAVDRDSKVLSALKVLSGFDTDLTHECIREINRLRSRRGLPMDFINPHGFGGVTELGSRAAGASGCRQ